MSDVPTEKEKKVVFTRPVFSSELMTEDGKKNFDKLPAWQRHLVKRLIDHGDLQRAAQEAGVGTYAKKLVDEERVQDLTITKALNDGGMTSEVLTNHLWECLEAKCIRFDKHSNPINTIDLNLKLKTLELIFKLRGDFKTTKQQGETEDLFPDTPI